MLFNRSYNDVFCIYYNIVKIIHIVIHFKKYPFKYICDESFYSIIYSIIKRKSSDYNYYHNFFV